MSALTVSAWPIAALMGVLGLAVGSFLNVVIYRLPREESVIFPASRCPSCDTRIKARHNIPVVSWLLLRGHCAYCSTPISARYPLVEAGTALLFAGITLRFGVSPQLPAYLYFAALAVTLAMIDLDVRRLPNSIVLPSYVVTVLLLMPAGAADADWRPAERALVGMVALVSIYFAMQIAYPLGVTSGDVKLAGLLGLYLGWLSWAAILIGALGGLVVGGVTSMTLGAVRSRHSVLVVALGPCMIAAAGAALFVTVPLTSWYGSLLA